MIHRAAIPAKANASVQNADGFSAFQDIGQLFSGERPVHPDFNQADLHALFSQGINHRLGGTGGAAGGDQNNIGIIAV